MLLEAASGLFSLGCVAASARRLAWAVEPTSLDPQLLLEALGGDEGARVVDDLRKAIASCPEFAWEAELLEAACVRDERARGALVNEQLTELDARANRWVGVPRVCARLATSVGFLCACLGLIQGLALPADGDAPAALHSALIGALGALTLGIAGTSFCVAVHGTAREAWRERMAGTSRLVERLTLLTQTGTM